MSVQYTINFLNQQKSTNDYTLFMQPPASDFSTAVWRQETVSDDGNFQIVLTPEIYAWVGTAPKQVAPGVVVGRGQGKIAILGSDSAKGSTFDALARQGAISMKEGTPSASPGNFQISVDPYQPDGTAYLMGMAQLDSHQIPSPVAVVPATPNMTKNVLPIYKFFIAQETHEPREIVDFNGISKKAGVVDFSQGPGLTQHVATVYHKKDGSFETKYSYTFNN
ncbi:hypothetical protein CFD26_104499 [Aspergillus turcosus]|uniref:Uncharacterized protein n=1 Tax=Aspergillus turcosus TaxID=1245748 RepID=A0A3R7J7Z1_9EURO|nr:hypothetical protein CFD26_104499 [Aspergillus turcosus]